MKDKNIGKVIQNRWKFSKLQQDNIFDDFARYRALWQSKIVDTTGWPWDYSLFNPMVFSTLRSFVARTATGSPGITLQAWNEEDRPKTRVNQELVMWEFEECEFQKKIARAIFNSGLYGKGFVYTGWLYQKERYVEEEDEQGKVTRKILISPKVNRADLANKRVYDIFVANRNLPDIQMQPWVIIRYYRTIAELKKINKMRGGDVYTNLDKLKDKNLFVRFVDFGRDVMYNDNSEIPFDNGVLELWEMWDQDEGRVYEMVARHPEFVIRKEDNPYYHGDIPLVETTFFPEDDEFWSTGLIRPMEDLQMALNATLNQYLTNARQQLNNMWLTGDTRIPDWEFISRPNGVIHTNGNIDQIREVQHKDITQTAMAMMNEMRTDIQRTTGINDYLAMGTPNQGRKGAAALRMEEQNLDQNLKLFMTFLEQETIRKIAKHFLANNKQYITSEQSFNIAGRHGYRHVNIKDDEVSAGFDPIVIPNSVMPKDPIIKGQNLMQLKEMADNEQKININTAPIWKEIVSTMGLTDMDEIIPDDRDEALEENELLKKGIPVEVEVSDNHDLHVTVHQFALIKEKLDQKTAKRFIDHISEHKMWKIAQNPNLIEQMTGNQQIPKPPNLLGPEQNTPTQQPVVNQGQPMQAATSPLGVVQQQGQQLTQPGIPSTIPGVGVGI